MPRKKKHVSFNKNDTDKIATELFKPFKKYYSVDKYDRNLKDYRDRVKSLFNRLYDEFVSDIKIDYGTEIFNSLKVDNIYRKRRISAFIDIASETAEKFEDKYQDICIEYELSIFCGEFYVNPPDEIDKRENLKLAAALFILDAIKKSGNFDDAVYFIPHDERINDIELSFGLKDSTFTNDVIKGVIYLIENRHGSDFVFYSPETASLSAEKCSFCEYRQYAPVFEEKDYSDDDENIAEEYIKLYETAEKMTMKERYYALLSFIRPEIIERAVKRYRDKSFEFLDIVLGCAAKTQKESFRIAEAAKKNVDSIIRIHNRMNEYERKMEKREKQFKNSKTVFSVLNTSYEGLLGQDEDDDMDFDFINLMERYDAVVERLDENANELCSKEIELTDHYTELISNLSENLHDINSSRTEEFTINNPYEIIFGFMFALDSADSLAWCPNIMEPVLGYAVKQLPWNFKRNKVLYKKLTEALDDFCTEYEKPDFEFIEQYESFYEDDDDKYAEEYKLKYTDAFLFMQNDFKYHKEDLLSYNLPQVLFSNSFIVPPRYDEKQNISFPIFVKSGFTRKQAELMCYYKAFVDSCADDKLGFDKVKKVEKVIKENSPEGLEKISHEDLLSAVLDKNAEIERLKKKLYSSERKNAEFEKQIAGINEKYESDSQELIELRELIYKIQNSSGEEKFEETSISFPYRANARIVVYGGHATWLKVIVKLLPNVKFIDPYADPDVNSIRNADVVWMQTNAMPHNKYNKIMEIVRLNRIPVKYFAYASAEKCAIQLAEFDMKA